MRRGGAFRKEVGIEEGGEEEREGFKSGYCERWDVAGGDRGKACGDGEEGHACCCRESR